MFVNEEVADGNGLEGFDYFVLVDELLGDFLFAGQIGQDPETFRELGNGNGLEVSGLFSTAIH